MKRNQNIPNLLQSVLGVLLFSLASTLISSAQNVRNTDYSPDQALKSNARVNPSTLAMELSLPLGGYPGRAGNGIPISLSYSSKAWEFKNLAVWESDIGQTINGIQPQFAKRSAGGWTSSLGTPRIDYKYEIYQGSSQNVLYEGQIFAPAPWENPPDDPLYYIKRLQVMMPDGSSHELRASDSPIYCGSINGGTSGIDQTGTFLSVDGSKMRLEAGQSSSTLYLPDGSRYLFGENPGGTAGNAAHTFIDRHGNRMTYNASGRYWTDTLGRVIYDPVAFNWNGVQNQAEGIETKHFPGLGEDTYDVSFTWRYLKDPNNVEHALENPSDALHKLSNRYCNGNEVGTVSGATLFSGADTYTKVCGGTTSSGIEFNPILLTKVTLPNGQYYQFNYNVYGEITKIVYPTGAYERFAYSVIPPVQVGNPVYDMANRGVTERWVSPTGNGGDELHWTYEASRGTLQSPTAYMVKVTAPDTSYTVQYIEDEPDANSSRPYGYSDAKTGRSYEDRVYDSSSSHNLIRKNLTEYTTTGALAGGFAEATRDMRPAKQVSIIFEPGDSYALASMTETVYDSSGNSDPAYFSSLNAKQTKKYDYVVVSASTAVTADISTAIGWFSSATPAVVTEMDYLYDSNYKARNIAGLVSETRVKDSAGNVKAKSQITYDGASLLDESESTRWENPSTNYRGLVTKTRSWYDIANNLYIDTQAQYDLMGNVRYSWDGKGNLSQVEYSSTYDHAYPTKTISPIPDTNGTYGLDVELETTTTYDLNTALPLTVTDPNGAVTSMEYDDPLLRPTKVTTGYGTALAAETVTEYGTGTNASTRWVKVRSQIDATNWKEAISWFDALGRGIRTQNIDPESGDVFTLTCYDDMGRISKTSNPFRGYSSTTHNCATTNGTSDIYWTSNTFDSAGRPWKVTAPDGAEVETTYGLASTSGYLLGSVVTVEDQAGKLRRSITNALGQLKRVDEPNGSNALGALTAPNQDTTYAYDLLNNLTAVTQGAQTRTFTYDALSRLKTAVNPESGTINYTYDENNNLVSKVDARSITTTYAYDRLNRVTQRTYTNEPSGSDTPDVAYYYDDLTNAKGKLTKVSSSVSTTEYTSFDILGRVTAAKQTTDGGDSAGYTTGYTYKLNGALDEETYPSGRVVKNVLDNTGDLSIVQSKKDGNSGFWHYADSFTYNAAGAVTSMQLGNGRWESTAFNSRLQPTQIALGSTNAATDLLKLNYTYNTTGNADNNGNVLSQTITVPTVGSNNGFVAVQSYSYDPLNRLKDAVENVTPTGGSSSQSWKQEFSFDRYGNRSFVTGTGHTDTLGSCTTMCNPTFDATNNRITSSGFSYDSSGNTTRDAADRKFTYDAENKQTKAETLSAGTNTVTGTIGEYSYDGDGRRVKKYVPSTGETTIFVYDAAGKQIAEYSTIVANSTDAKVNYLTADHLGSPRINTDAIGSVTSRSDYLPYGEEITGGRSSGQGYVVDDVRQGFTGYERDDETDLDFAQARMYGKFHGRFTSPDPLLASAKAAVPQSFNRYVYVLNSPLKLTDPNGLKPVYISNKDSSSFIYLDDRSDDYKKYTSKKGGFHLYTPKSNERFINTDGDIVGFGAGGFINHGSARLATAEVYRWAPNGDSPGHLAIKITHPGKDPIYISFYPTRDGGGTLGEIITKTPIDATGTLRPQNKDDTRETTPDVLTVDRLDWKAIQKYYDQLRSNPGDWSLNRNCADIVAQTLQAGGVVLNNNQRSNSTVGGTFEIIKGAAPLGRTEGQQPNFKGVYSGWGYPDIQE
jgi:RHS repeat-associated protein